MRTERMNPNYFQECIEYARRLNREDAHTAPPLDTLARLRAERERARK